jgi:hypothetical protein
VEDNVLTCSKKQSCHELFCFIPSDNAKDKGFCCVYCKNLGRCFESHEKSISGDGCYKLFYLMHQDQLKRLIFLSHSITVISPAEELNRRRKNRDESIVEPDKREIDEIF